jgi:hypothetical protein
VDHHAGRVEQGRESRPPHRGDLVEHSPLDLASLEDGPRGDLGAGGRQGPLKEGREKDVVEPGPALVSDFEERGDGGQGSERIAAFAGLSPRL